MKKISTKVRFDIIQKTALLGTGHILRNFLSDSGKHIINIIRNIRRLHTDVEVMTYVWIRCISENLDQKLLR